MMVWVSLSCVFGSLFPKVLNERVSVKTAIIIQMVGGTFGYSWCVFANEMHVFGWPWLIGCLLYGFTDGSLNTQLNIILGSEFEEKIEPFAVNKMI